MKNRSFYVITAAVCIIMLSGIFALGGINTQAKVLSATGRPASASVKPVADALTVRTSAISDSFDNEDFSTGWKIVIIALAILIDIAAVGIAIAFTAAYLAGSAKKRRLAMSTGQNTANGQGYRPAAGYAPYNPGAGGYQAGTAQPYYGGTGAAQPGTQPPAGTANAYQTGTPAGYQAAGYQAGTVQTDSAGVDTAQPSAGTDQTPGNLPG